MTLPLIADDPLVAALAREGVRYDAETAFPAASMALLRDHGLHRRFAPPAAQGHPFPTASAYHAALLDQLRRVGRGDLSVGRLYEGHVNALLLFGWYATPEQLDWLSSVLDAGAFFGVWATEPAPGVSLANDTLLGAKSFASGAGGIDYAIVTAQPASGDRQLVVVDAKDPTRTDAGGWRMRGMRASVSGRYDLTGLHVPDLRRLGKPGVYDREPRFTAGAWRFAAAQLGGIEALLAATRDGLSDASRADPLARAGFGTAIVATRTALAWVRDAARQAAEESSQAIAVARMTRGVVERAGLDVMEQAARLLGTRSAFDGTRADKIIRDLSLYLRQAGPDHARDAAVVDWLMNDRFAGDALW